MSSSHYVVDGMHNYLLVEVIFLISSYCQDSYIGDNHWSAKAIYELIYKIAFKCEHTYLVISYEIL